MWILRNVWWLISHDLAELETALMAQMDDFAAALAQINEATNAVAAEVARLKEIIAGGGLSPAQEAEVLASLGDIEARLRAIAAPSEPA